MRTLGVTCLDAASAAQYLDGASGSVSVMATALVWARESGLRKAMRLAVCWAGVTVPMTLEGAWDYLSEWM